MNRPQPKDYYSFPLAKHWQTQQEDRTLILALNEYIDWLEGRNHEQTNTHPLQRGKVR